MGLFTVPPEKIMDAISAILTAVRVPVRLAARVVGHNISLGLAVGLITQLRTRFLYGIVGLGTTKFTCLRRQWRSFKIRVFVFVYACCVHTNFHTSS